MPAEERSDLIAEVEASLLDAGEPPALSPAAFAAELREAAGFTRGATVAERRSPLDTARIWLASPRAAALQETARELAPVWWVVRGLALAGIVVFSLGWEWSLSIQNALLTALAAVAASVWLGRRSRPLRGVRRAVAIAANVALALLLLPLVSTSLGVLESRAGGYTVVNPEPVPVPGLAIDGNPVENVYVYDRDGRPLWDVRLYDEEGRPLDVRAGDEDSFRRVVVDAKGDRLFNSFPIRFVEPGTVDVAKPALGPKLDVPRLVTPPLAVKPKP